tara:strand:- start:211 stop:501 length:291 start_codon:yes stop_codon:yes gene_type:complete
LKDHLQTLSDTPMLSLGKTPVMQVMAVYQDSPATGPKQANCDSSDSGFAGATFTDQCIGLPSLDGERDIVHSVQKAFRSTGNHSRKPWIRQIKASA